MKGKIKEFLKHSFIYGISNVAAKAAGIILIPLYTSDRFTQAEFGQYSLVYITITILTGLISLGQGISVVYYNNTAEYSDKRKTYFFTVTAFAVSSAIVFAIISFLLLSFVGPAFIKNTAYIGYFRLAVIIIALQVINNLFLNKLRADQKSGIYTMLSIARLATVLALNLYYIVYCNMTVEGILLAQLFGDLIIVILPIPLLYKDFEFKLNTQLLKESLKYGFPLIFSTLAMNMLNLSDRYIIKYFSGDSAVGLYDLGYRVAGIINMFFILPFSAALLPAAYKIYKQPGDIEYFRKLMTLTTLFLTIAAVFQSAFGREILIAFTNNPAFHKASEYVPILSVSYIFVGISMIAAIGLYCTKKTRTVAYITFFAGIINIAGNFILIPLFGLVGAALSTLLCFIILLFLNKHYSDKYYYIEFENLKIIVIIVLGTIAAVLIPLMDTGSILYDIFIKLFILIPFSVLLLIKVIGIKDLKRLPDLLRIGK